jgi:hypothetical protein
MFFSARQWLANCLCHADMDVIFALAYKEGVSPVKVSLRKDIPSAGTPEADEILGVSMSRGSGSVNEEKGKE